MELQNEALTEKKMAICPVELATVLPGAIAFKENNNVTDTYRGQVLRPDGTVSAAVVKDLHGKELANELIAFILARELDLPIPVAYLARVRSEVLRLTKAPQMSDGSRLAFASVDVQSPNLAFRYTSDVPGQARLLGAVTAWPPLGRLYGFDAWIANVDRHPGNLLFSSGAQAWLIDHGWAFSGPTWASADLVATREYRHRLGEWLTPHLTQTGRTSRANQAGVLESNLSTFDVEGAIDASHASAFLSKDELASVRAFLEERVVEITRLASNALGVPVIL